MTPKVRFYSDDMEYKWQIKIETVMQWALDMAEDFAKKYKDNSLTFDADNRYRAMEFLHYELLQLVSDKILLSVPDHL